MQSSVQLKAESYENDKSNMFDIAILDFESTKLNKPEIGFLLFIVLLIIRLKANK